MSHDIHYSRRRFIGTTAMTFAAARLSVARPDAAQSTGTSRAKNPATAAETGSFSRPIKMVEAGLLNVGYAEAGSIGQPVVILLHGWPYDIHSFADVASLLEATGYRVIVPYL